MKKAVEQGKNQSCEGGESCPILMHKTKIQTLWKFEAIEFQLPWRDKSRQQQTKQKIYFCLVREDQQKLLPGSQTSVESVYIYSVWFSGSWKEDKLK